MCVDDRQGRRNDNETAADMMRLFVHGSDKEQTLSSTYVRTQERERPMCGQTLISTHSSRPHGRQSCHDSVSLSFAHAYKRVLREEDVMIMSVIMSPSTQGNRRRATDNESTTFSLLSLADNCLAWKRKRKKERNSSHSLSSPVNRVEE